MTTASTEEAMALLRAHRAAQIAKGQEVAEYLIRRQGKTNSRQVWETMRDTGVLDETVDAHWLGALFRDSRRFQWTGEWVIPALPADTAIHAQRPIKVWKLTQSYLMFGIPQRKRGKRP